MLRRRFPLGLVAPIALVILVIALGALQYRWVGQVSERERDQLRQSLDRRAREFADDFDREVSRTYQVFQQDAPFTLASPDRFVRQYDEWASVSPFAGLVKAFYFAESVHDDYTLYRYVPDQRRFDETAWPAGLEPIHARLNQAYGRLAPDLAGPASIRAITAPTVVATVPAIVIPQAHSEPVTTQETSRAFSAGSTFTMRVTLAAGRNCLVLELDKAFIGGTLLPALVQRHFPETGPDRFRVLVTAGKSDVLFSRGLAAGQTIDVASADASADFFGLRLEILKSMVASGPAGAGSAAAGTALSAVRRQDAEMAVQRQRVTPVTKDTLVLTAPPLASATRGFSMVIEQNATTKMRAAMGGWTVLLQHEAGSLDAAVAMARRRNLFMSFGILSVLAASAGLVMVNARRSEKLAAQQMEFVATVSHELRTPLAVIRSAAQNLSAGVVLDAGQAQRYGDLIESEGRRLTDMVEQVLEYAGLNDAKRRLAPKPMDAAPVLRDIVEASSSLPEANGVNFDVRIDDNVPAVLADEAAIRRALHNLIGNALKYAADGRWVGVTATRGQGGDEGFVLVSVADKGRGIAADDLAHIFEPFYRGRQAVDQQIRGNGLGLSLVKQLLAALGGRVSVKSAPGQGTMFTLHLPVAAGSASAPEPA